MENIRQAIERAKALTEQQSGVGSGIALKQVRHGPSAVYGGKERAEEVELDLAYLQSQRMVAYDGNDPRSRPFDILRTEVLRSMDLQGWKVLAVTSPTPSCGKTLTAVNLALSLARQPERQVFLADLDLRMPRVAASLGLKCREGLLDVIEAGVDVDMATVQVRAGNSRVEVLPTTPASNASDLIDSSALKALLRDIAERGRSRIIILDLPPILTSHDVISLLPELDCVLLVAAAGLSTIADIEECSKYLQATDVVRFVLNKVPNAATNYAYY
jgi:protein-tyrosine kinase